MSRTKYYGQQQRKYTIRKFAMGTASVLIGSVFLMGGSTTGNTTVLAEVISNNSNLLESSNEVVSKEVQKELDSLETQKKGELTGKEQVDNFLAELDKKEQEYARLEFSLYNIEDDLAVLEEVNKQITESLKVRDEQLNTAEGNEREQIQEEIKRLNVSKSNLDQEKAKYEEVIRQVEESMQLLGTRESRSAERVRYVKALSDILDNLQAIDDAISQLQHKVRVKVVDNASNPVVGATVEFSTDGFGSGQQAVTDAEGYVTFVAKEGTKVEARVVAVPAGYEANYMYRASLTVSSEEVASDFIAVDKHEDLRTLTPLPLYQNEVRIKVVDNASNPVPGATVEFSTDGFGSGQQVVTDADGYATFAAEVGTKVEARVVAVPAGYEADYMYRLPLTVSSDEVVGDFIAVEKYATATDTGVYQNEVRVKVVDNVSNPVSGATVEFSTDGFGSGQQVVTDADGYATFAAEVGTKVEARVVAVPTGYATDYMYRLPLTVSSDEVVEDFIAVEKYATATGTGVYQWNTGANTDNPSVVDKESYTHGTGVYQTTTSPSTSQITSPATTTQSTKPTQTTSQSVPNVVSESKEETKEEVTTANVTSSEVGNSSQVSTTQAGKVLPNTGEATTFAGLAAAALALVGGVFAVLPRFKKEQ